MHPSLLPYADAPPVRIGRYVAAGALIGAAILALAAGVLERRAHTCTFGSSREEVAEDTTRKLAFEAYPEWRAAFWNGPTCPASLHALLPWTNNNDTLDPWGTDYAFWCGRTASREPALHVLSAGPDRQFDTGDDIGSEL